MGFSKILLWTFFLHPLPAFTHSTLHSLWANGHYYKTHIPTTPIWPTRNNAPLYPSDLSSTSIICGTGASNPNFSATVAAGGDVRVRWWGDGGKGPETAWPLGHRGVIVSYIAECGRERCEGVELEKLRFVKVGERGREDVYVDVGGRKVYTQGRWATEEMIARNGTWVIRIPERLTPGSYILRTEIIALHSAFASTGVGSPAGAEFHPRCVSLRVEGNGRGSVGITGGVYARELYKGDEAGLRVNIHKRGRDLEDYEMPGPKLWRGPDGGG